MCGISGFIDFNKQSSESVLLSMTDSLTHRGPDGFGIELVEEEGFQIGLGHRRLSILELSELGKQPMTWMQYTIVFNGEVYNFQEIKAELVNLGHNFISNSDTEMILHAYHEWGTECISRFIGMFSFVIYNKDNQQVFFVRDRAGVKPLFIYRSDDLLLFASELKAFHEHPRFKK
jgi:asparagine synthase (glutamine-hydrolysing)